MFSLGGALRPFSGGVMAELKLTVDDGVLSELAYIVKLHKAHGAPNPHETVESLVLYVLSAVADGHRRPGAWERSMLDSMGIVPETDLSYEYRPQYGEPK
jgi:hypothetical protein